MYQQTRNDADFQAIADRCRNLAFFVSRRASRRWPGVRVDDDDAAAAAQVGLWLAALRWASEGGASFLTWAYRCMRGQVNKVYVRQARAWRVVSLDGETGDDGTPLADLLADPAAVDPEAEPARQDLAARLQQLVDQHCTPRQCVFIRQWLQGWPLRAIAADAGLSVEGARKVILQSCRRLAQAIGDASTLQAAPGLDPLAWDWGPITNMAAVYDLERDGRLGTQLEAILLAEVKRRMDAGERPPAVAPIPALLADRRRRGVNLRASTCSTQ
jgi:RNA polymerase sigma factor (sigma-70 family)